MTLSEIRDALTARRLVALNIASAASGGWQASARSEGGTGWLVGLGDTIEAAVHELLANACRSAVWEGKTRYFAGAAGTLHVTYNGAEPLQSEGGPFTEMTAAEWAARRRELDAPPRDEFDDLLDL